MSTVREGKQDMRITRRAAAAGLGALPWAGIAQARAQIQPPNPPINPPTWPNRTMRIVVPFGAGGPVEVPARLIAEAIAPTLGQTILVENRPGAGGALGVQAVVQANDPHTLLLTTGSVAIIPALMANPGFDPLRDLVPITMVNESAMVVLVRPDNPNRDLATLVARARENPGAITYGSSGVGATTHLGGALLAVRAGIDLLHVPYRGAGQSVAALYAGDIDLLVTGTIEALPHVRDGRLKAIGVTTAGRLPSLPDVPAIGEQVPGYAMSIWYAMFGPRSTPPAVVDRMMAALAPLKLGSTLARRMEENGAQLLLDGPGPLAARLREEVPQWRQVAQRAGLRAE